MDWQMTGIPLSPTSTASEISYAATVSSAGSTWLDERPAAGVYLSQRPAVDHVNALQLAI